MIIPEGRLERLVRKTHRGLRERQVLEQLLAGAGSNAEIAATLGTSERALRGALFLLSARLHANAKHQIVVRALRMAQEAGPNDPAAPLL